MFCTMNIPSHSSSPWRRSCVRSAVGEGPQIGSRLWCLVTHRCPASPPGSPALRGRQIDTATPPSLVPHQQLAVLGSDGIPARPHLHPLLARLCRPSREPPCQV